MTLNDTVNYVFFTNPISNGVISGLSGLAKSVGIKPKASSIPTKSTIATQTMAHTTQSLWRLSGCNAYFIRLAGISGASAVILGAYGAHKPFPESKDVDLRRIFETANRFHFLHTLALLGVPLVHRPMLTGTLMMTGMILFCGTCYYRSFTGNQKFGKLAPVGGICLILAWASMIF